MHCKFRYYLKQLFPLLYQLFPLLYLYVPNIFILFLICYIL